ncbi:outer membrane lipoprotein carrier protein LolA [Aquiflexum sp. LQ15W]|uniref:LolA family protein n=1 Tax=Cognataquiflexum nitidum TaxID=2922272 RepID=UPI001F13C96C|nr:outer membrane lipoprotein carrier protein LolA [Cognataquiflexum nitidum]MCH6198065.1 outer membrane lipoprotein carrier protein LolA [Cognataquiflexum nitidum]
MKKLSATLIIAIFFVSGVFSQTKDPKAKAVLDGVSQKYASIKGLKASFEFSYSDVSDGRTQNQSGEIAIKGNKYHLKLPEQEIFNNGKTVWTYIESDSYKEVTINNSSDMENELTPSSVYTIYQKGYNYRLIGEKTEGSMVIQEIELTAEKSNAPFKRVKLFVDKNKKDLISWEIYDDQGGTFKYKFKSVNTNAELTDDYFTFNPQKYGKVEIIDLR